MLPLPDFIKNIPTHMDFVGQKQAERIFQIIIVVFGVVGFGAGFVAQRFSYTVYSVIAAFAISCLVTLPPWPCFRRHPLPWLPASVTNSDASGNDSGLKSKKKK